MSEQPTDQETPAVREDAGADSESLSQDDLDKMIAEAKDAASSLEQAADAMVGDAEKLAADAAPAQQEPSGTLSQQDMDKLIADAQGGGAAPAAPADPPAAEEPSGTLSQEDMDKLIADAQGGGAAQAATAKQAPAAQATGTEETQGLAGDLDGLLGGGAEPAKPSAEQTDDLAGDLDALLGGGAAPAKPTIAETDDLAGDLDALFGGQKKTPPAAAPATGAPGNSKAVSQADVDALFSGGGDLAAQAPAPATQGFALPDFASSGPGPHASGIDLLNDVDLDVKIELGRSRMYVDDILRLAEGSIVELDKLAGDPVDVLVNERLVARGEILVLNDNFCVRVHQIVGTINED